MSNSLQTRGLQHARLPCPSPFPGLSSNSCPSHPLLPPSPALNLSRHQGLFQWVISSHQVAKGLEFQLQHQSFHEYSGLVSFGWTGWISLQSKGLSRVFSSTSVQSINSLALSLLYFIFLSLVAKMVKNPPKMQETYIQFLDWEDPLEKQVTTHFSILAWRIPWTEDTGGLQSMGS